MYEKLKNRGDDFPMRKMFSIVLLSMLFSGCGVEKIATPPTAATPSISSSPVQSMTATRSPDPFPTPTVTQTPTPDLTLSSPTVYNGPVIYLDPEQYKAMPDHYEIAKKINEMVKAINEKNKQKYVTLYQPNSTEVDRDFNNLLIRNLIINKVEIIKFGKKEWSQIEVIAKFYFPDDFDDFQLFFKQENNRWQLITYES